MTFLMARKRIRSLKSDESESERFGDKKSIIGGFYFMDEYSRTGKLRKRKS